ncbi:T9SS type A sorting domain-containing protein [Taibaiella soli]|uniref:Secretion system C-terminal sorting domain-containing protein n=1 Tax=Taibaiella soli TaxID=1649169 RepID=A0A2W2BT87_9BACT|nr:T9SS type A sorting domain-containing protein [Taibaiella soli]PZF70983.1 hypothetical protein DN068_19955 [Taibaiella soli]
MKKLTYSLKAFTLCMLLFAVNAKAGDPAVNGATVNPAPISVAGNNSISFQFVNIGTAITAPQASQVTVTISLSDLTLHPGYNLSTNITGNGASLFTWSFDAGTNVITGVLNQALANAQGGTITVGNLDVTALTTSAAPGNGANINVVASGAVNSSTTNDATSSFTYTLSPLPIKLTSFTATAEGCNTMLNWHSATERDFSHFTLQYSHDGADYQNIAVISGKGDNSDYTYVHQAGNGRAMYRLVLTDNNGVVNYSNTAVANISCDAAANVQIVPNPVQNIFSLRIENVTTSNYTGVATVYNAMGMSVRTQDVRSGDNKIDMTGLAAGMYTVTLQDANGISNYKLVKE